MIDILLEGADFRKKKNLLLLIKVSRTWKILGRKVERTFKNTPPGNKFLLIDFSRILKVQLPTVPTLILSKRDFSVENRFNLKFWKFAKNEKIEFSYVSTSFFCCFFVFQVTFNHLSAGRDILLCWESFDYST